MGNLHKCFESTLAEVGFVNAELLTAVFKGSFLLAECSLYNADSYL